MKSTGQHLEQVARELSQLTIDQLRENISVHGPEEICSFIAFLGVCNDPFIIEKTRTVISQIDHPSQLEAIGKGMNVEQFLDTLNLGIEKNVTFINKIPQIIMGLNHVIFASVINHANVDQLNYLKMEGMSEPVQHQLTILTHLLQNHSNALLKEIDFLEHEIKTLALEDLSDDKLKNWYGSTQSYHQKIISYLISFQNALSIAWHTNRVDLIDSLSENKEIIQRYLATVLGHSKSKSHNSTGLYALIEYKLNSVYGDSNNPEDVEALRDDEPAIEGLAKLGVWHIADYQAINLLPNPTAGESEINPQRDQASVLNAVQNSLANLDITTIGDLKKHKIYSKESLTAYIKSKEN